MYLNPGSDFILKDVQRATWMENHTVLLIKWPNNDQRTPRFIYCHRSEWVGERAFRVQWHDSLDRKTAE